MPHGGVQQQQRLRRFPRVRVVVDVVGNVQAVTGLECGCCQLGLLPVFSHGRTKPIVRRYVTAGSPQVFACCTAASNPGESKAGRLCSRPSPSATCQTEKVSIASALGASTTSTKSYGPCV